jgi:hypothetical protein
VLIYKQGNGSNHVFNISHRGVMQPENNGTRQHALELYVHARKLGQQHPHGWPRKSGGREGHRSIVNLRQRQICFPFAWESSAAAACRSCSIQRRPSKVGCKQTMSASAPFSSCSCTSRSCTVHKRSILFISILHLLLFCHFIIQILFSNHYHF